MERFRTAVEDGHWREFGRKNECSGAKDNEYIWGFKKMKQWAMSAHLKTWEQFIVNYRLIINIISYSDSPAAASGPCKDRVAMVNIHSLGFTYIG